MTEKFNDFMNQVDIATHNLNEKEKNRIRESETQHCTVYTTFNFHKIIQLSIAFFE